MLPCWLSNSLQTPSTVMICPRLVLIISRCSSVTPAFMRICSAKRSSGNLISLSRSVSIAYHDLLLIVYVLIGSPSCLLRTPCSGSSEVELSGFLLVSRPQGSHNGPLSLTRTSSLTAFTMWSAGPRRPSTNRSPRGPKFFTSPGPLFHTKSNPVGVF